MTLILQSENAESAKGVKISITAVAQVKVTAMDASSGEVDINSVRLAASHFMGKTDEDIEDAIKRTLEGHQRQIIGTLTVEEIYKDRAAFSERVREHVVEDLKSLGITLASYTVTNIGDENGYMDALGATATSAVKREAEEGTARNVAEAKKVVSRTMADAAVAEAEAMKMAHNAKALQGQAMAEADRDLELKRSRYASEVNKAREEAEAATRIERAIQNKAVIRETTQQQVEEAQVLLLVTEQQVARQKAELAGASEAKLLEQRNIAKSIEVAAEAEAGRIRRLGEAEADALLKRGEAEAEVLRSKAQAYKEYGTAALIQSVVEQLPAIASAVAEPLGKTEKMIFISQDGSAGSQLTKDITRIMAELPDTVEALSGVDIKKAFKRLTAGEASNSSGVNSTE
eukprot:CAMPEP_0196588584 /NCGR_PEP_ID=MMETSP1081-20130531/61008_1 /TAXON_ID=36882 /ORGANISM="Pyramimonas amylifera, Strain CCMP720" /LENGTH=401 /DNA_ID=CAMNT_0041911115 /DNA_START=230 /DNA_END=1435 /DNA_ORIENTATION=-